MDSDGVHRLCAGIVARGCKDYISRKKRLAKTPPWHRDYDFHKSQLDECINFFTSNWYEMIMPNTDGKMLMKRLDELAINGKRLEHGDKGDKYVCKQ